MKIQIINRPNLNLPDECKPDVNERIDYSYKRLNVINYMLTFDVSNEIR